MNTYIKLNRKYIDFYWKLKNHHNACKKYKFGKGHLPSKYTEELCRKLYGLNEYENRDFDAIDSNFNKIEIKATISGSGTTTISSKKFDILYWLYFNFEDDNLFIYKIKYNDMNLCLDKGRRTISLNNFIENAECKLYKFTEEGLLLQ